VRTRPRLFAGSPAVLGEEAAHATLGFVAEREAEVSVDAAHGLDLVADEVAELDVEGALGRNEPVALDHRLREPRGEANRPVGADRDGIDRIARQAAQMAEEARQRGDDLQRVAVRLHDPCIRILVQQVIERPQVAGRFEHPAFRRAAPLQILELAAV
jgi:hypothetical protein